MTRYDFASLERLLDGSDHTLAAKLGVSGATLSNYRRNGMSERTAERLAVRAGFHAFVVWPELTEARCRSVEQECAAPGCDVRFVSSRPQAHQRFCSRRCQQRQPSQKAMRSARDRRYRGKPGPAEKNVERRRAYYRANAEYEKARQRAYYRAKKAAA